MNEISPDELLCLPKDSYVLVDIRDEGLRLYGMIPGAVSVSYEELLCGSCKRLAVIPKEKKLVFYCEIGRRTRDMEEPASLEGRECFSLEGGYIGYIRSGLADNEKQREKQKKAEESIRNKYHKLLFSPFAKACKTYQLIREDDHIAVCISGGKDSMLMAKLFQEIQKHRKVSFELTFLVMDPGYNKENRTLIESNARTLGIPVTIFESEIFNAVDRIDKNPCYICARMRRGYLYKQRSSAATRSLWGITMTM